MKFKSFTLVEILVASMIFMIVIVVSVSSFGMISRSSVKTDDLRLTNQCARQVEDYSDALSDQIDKEPTSWWPDQLWSCRGL